MKKESNEQERISARSKISSAFLALLEATDMSKITVTQLCEKANVNRSTFYENFGNFANLLASLRESMTQEFSEICDGSVGGTSEENFLRLFKSIRENPSFYRAYIKLGFDTADGFKYDKAFAQKRFGDRNTDFHIEFFKGGLNALIKKWLDDGCKESAEEMVQILLDEYGI